MAESALYQSCGCFDISHDPGDMHCMSCGGSLDKGEHQNDTNDILLTLVTQVNAILARKTKGFLGAHRELKISVASGALCTLWMFSCLTIVNVQSFGSAVLGGDTTVAVQIAGRRASMARPSTASRRTGGIDGWVNWRKS